MRPRTATRVRRAAILAAASSVTLAGTVAFAASSDASIDKHAWTAFSASSVVSVLNPDKEAS
ncbi:hypothetical protein [Hoyosella subflava]|uniref:Uncharacterized protein n=1 Tax=Hoyosella subflava (strain DSM 45089 / JCM 17490 / NBRC 109087 / DQS3-9A1) TaxID=443218 RepID=F6EHJ5_HOYSD|nr:hypothetical protein [Hoyosella subflava]AEF42359.1 hypothetical protein AS9A_3923 [Hoyosella subflava DQS3-9A1]